METAWCEGGWGARKWARPMDADQVCFRSALAMHLRAASGWPSDCTEKAEPSTVDVCTEL